MKRYLIIFFLSLIIFFGIAALRGGYVTILGVTGFALSSGIGFIVMFGLTLFSLLKNKQLNHKKIVLSILSGISIFELSFRLFFFVDNDGNLISLLTYILWCLGILAGYLIFLVIINRRCKIFIFSSVVVLFAICLFVTFGGYGMYVHKINYGTYLGKLNSNINGSLEFNDSRGNLINSHSFRGKYVLLDFWSTSCGVCYRKFPLVENVYNKYKDSQNFSLYGIHCRYEKSSESSSTGTSILESKGYTFPCLSIEINEAILKEIGVDGYPTVIVLDPKGAIVFRGTIERCIDFLDSCNI